MPAGLGKNNAASKLTAQHVNLALSRLAAIAQAEKRQALLESKEKHLEYMQSILERLEVERQKMRVIKEISPHLS